MCVVCGYEGVTEAEPQKMNVREAAICVRVEKLDARDSRREATACVCMCGCEGVAEAEPQKVLAREAAICVCV